MTLKKRIVVTAAGVLLTVGAAVWAHAQPRVEPPNTPVTPVTPTVMTGADLGFRVLGMRGQTPVGQLLVKVNGEWKEVEFGHDPLLQMR